MIGNHGARGRKRERKGDISSEANFRITKSARLVAEKLNVAYIIDFIRDGENNENNKANTIVCIFFNFIESLSVSPR